MNNSNDLVILILILTFLVSCGKKEVNKDGLIDDTERSIMVECSKNLLAYKNEIENNIIGKWNLIGHGTTIFQENPQPSINLTVSDVDLIFEYKNNSVEKVDTLSWEIEEINTPIGQSFKLITSPRNTALIINQFCNSYMYGETSPINGGGNMFLYEKLE